MTTGPRLVPYAGKDHGEIDLETLDETVLRLWRARLDTDRIARKLVISEWLAANILAVARDRQRA
jgi:hypothetical protein